MARFRLESIAELAREMEFTPSAKRSIQLSQAEELLHSIDAKTAYPVEFIVFRITGYHPRRAEALPELLTGLALQHDLGLLIEHVSATLNLQASSSAEPVLSIDDACDRLNVTSKTIQRWRRRGLPARMFIFPDGKQRVGFFVSSVEKFFAAHREQLDCGANFSQVDDDETSQIIRRAKRLAGPGGCGVAEVTRRVGRKLNRTPTTILHIIRKYDAAHPADAVFSTEPQSLCDKQRAAIVQAVGRGLALSSVAQRVGQTRSNVYRALLDARLAKVNDRKVKFIDDEIYHQDDAESQLAQLVSADVLADATDKESSREARSVPRDLPPYIAELYRTPLLSAAKERALFLQFNYYKYRFVATRRKLDPEVARLKDVALLESQLNRSAEVKNQIVAANLRLVVSVASKHLRPGVGLMELISEGNLILMRAVESFDPHMGNRFSTYATLALMKGFARASVELQQAGRQAAQVDPQRLVEIPDERSTQRTDRFIAREQVRELLSNLDSREQIILRAHYGLDENSTPASFDELAEELDLSPARVRQIKQAAIEKLRGSIS